MGSSQIDHLKDDKPGDARRPSQRARQKAETRLRLLQAATEVFIESGPASAPLVAVAARAGVSNPTLFFHFAGRQELLDQLVEHLLRKWFRAVPDRSPQSDLRSFMESYLRAQRHPEARLVWQLGDVLRSERPERPNAAYWATVAEIEQRMDTAAYEPDAAHRVAQVLASGLMLLARRAAFDYTSDTEELDFVSEACALAVTSSDLRTTP